MMKEKSYDVAKDLVEPLDDQFAVGIAVDEGLDDLVDLCLQLVVVHVRDRLDLFFGEVVRDHLELARVGCDVAFRHERRNLPRIYDDHPGSLDCFCRNSRSVQTG